MYYISPLKLWKFIIFTLISSFLTSHSLFAQFTFDENAIHEEFVLTSAFQEKIKTDPIAHEDPLAYLAMNLPLKKVLRYFSEKEATEIFLKKCATCDRVHTSSILLSNLYEKAITKHITADEEEAQLGDSNGDERFSEFDAIQLLKSGADLRNLVPPGSRILFPGRSALWIKAAFDFINSRVPSSRIPNPTYKSIQFNYSGKPDHPRFSDDLEEDDDLKSFLTNLVTPSRYQHFKEYILNSGLNLHDPSPIYIVDFLYTGESLLSLLKLLVRIYREENAQLPEISLIDISSPRHFFPEDPNKKKDIRINSRGEKEFYFDKSGDFRITYHSLDLSDLDLIDILTEAHDSCSLGCYYPPYRWKPDFDFERDRRQFSLAKKIFKNLVLEWEKYFNQNELKGLLFKQNENRMITSLEEVFMFIVYTLLNNKTETELKAQELLVVLDLESLLKRSYSSSLIKTLRNQGVQFVITYSQSPQDAHEILSSLDLSIALNLPDSIPVSHETWHMHTFRCNPLGPFVASVHSAEYPDLYQNALAPTCVMTPEQLNQIKHIIFVEDNKKSDELFRLRMSVMGSKFGENLKKVDYLLLPKD